MAAFGENFQGYATAPVFLNPLFASTSPSDFWGRKWNLTIHRNLKVCRSSWLLLWSLFFGIGIRTNSTLLFWFAYGTLRVQSFFPCGKNTASPPPWPLFSLLPWAVYCMTFSPASSFTNTSGIPCLKRLDSHMFLLTRKWWPSFCTTGPLSCWNVRSEECFPSGSRHSRYRFDRQWL